MKKIIIILFVLAIIGGGVYFFTFGKSGGEGDAKQSDSGTATSGATSEAIAEIATYQYTETFSHATNGFSFKYPKSFTVTSIPSDGNETVLIQNDEKKIGIQVVISPFDGGDIDITPDIIKTDIPDMKIDNTQELLVGPSRKGLAFVSDNEAFGGKSREVWFVFNGNLYQISTYYEFDDFLKGIFATWKFDNSINSIN